MRILLTGATGFLGNNLLRLLLDDGHKVKVTVRRDSDPRPLQGLNVESVVCDFFTGSGIADASNDVDVIIHSAAMIHIGWKRLDESRRVNVEATKQLAQAARLKKIRMIYVSTVDALAAGTAHVVADESDLEPAKLACSYVISKREAEDVFLEQTAAGLDGVIMNPGFMIGPWDWKPSSGQMLLAVGTQWTPLAPSGGCSVVDVRDVACGILSAMTNGRMGERYILAGNNISYFDLWCSMAAIAGARAPVGKLPKWINTLAGSYGDIVGKYSANEPRVNSAATKMGALYHWYCSDKARTELGFKIGDTNDAMADAWDWFKSYGYV